MHSVGPERTKRVLIGTRTTYQATGDAGYPNITPQYLLHVWHPMPPARLTSCYG